MSKKTVGGSRQAELFGRSKSPTIPIEASHRLVVLCDALDWTELETKVEEIRASKLKSAAGRPPRLRVLIGALVLKATRDMTWREAEDLIRHYAPARYLCGLTETEWTPDFTTLHDFAVLLGEDGVRLINEYAVKWAVREKLADPSVVVGDTTAQEAAVPYPNEMRLMAAFMTSLTAAGSRAGGVLKKLVEQVADETKRASEVVREYRLFADTKEKKEVLQARLLSLVEAVQEKLGRAVDAAQPVERLKGYAKVARAKVDQLHATMKSLTPQIQYWLRTGYVAANKVISLHVPQVYALVRGKVGRKVEFGLRWGITRLRGGYVLATMATQQKELADTKFAVSAVEHHVELFGQPPRAYAYDRGGFSRENVERLKRLGVKDVALAPRGRGVWAVDEKTKQELVKERALVEGAIGTVKSRRYGFNRPRARSARMMGTYGQMAVLGFNLNKLARAFASRSDASLVG